MKFSIVVPVFMHWDYIPDLLHCLENQNFPIEEFEVILVDNGSPGFSGIELPFSGSLRVEHCAIVGSYAARNVGVSVSCGEWVVFTDSDCLPGPRWLLSIASVVERAQLQNEFLVAGRVDVGSQSLSPGSYEIYDQVKGIPQSEYVKQGYAVTANLAVSQHVFSQLNGFDERLFSGGDKDFCRRAVLNGFEIVYADYAEVKHRARTEWEQIAVKARRLKGGQLRAAVGRNYYCSIIRTFLPPLLAIAKFARRKRFPISYRLLAAAIQLRVWLVEMCEIIRLLCRCEPERR